MKIRIEMTEQFLRMLQTLGEGAQADLIAFVEKINEPGYDLRTDPNVRPITPEEAEHLLHWLAEQEREREREHLN